jgi:pimeloyl-ACP methyl ester carboxylesterase
MKTSVRTFLAFAFCLLPFALTASPQGVTDAAFDLTTPTGTIAGSLVMPAGAGHVPVVVIVAGSGPTDRDGNTAGLPGKNNSYKLLAEALAQKGVASVRFDKRGVGASAGAATKEADLRFETYVTDAAAWVTKLRNDIRFTSVTVAGHSEGSLVGMLAARAARADAFVSIAGPAQRASDILRSQLKTQLAAAPPLADANESILRSLEQGQLAANVPQAFAALYRPSVQPYLISWFKYTPSAEFALLRQPALIIQGSTDIQVSADEAKALSAAKPGAVLKIIDGMNHVLKTAPAERAANMATYSDPSLPIVAAAPDAIASFVQGLRLPRHPTEQRRSLRDVVMAEIGGARLAIEYGRPSKRGRVIWGTLVPWSGHWMPGADESTTLTTSAPLTIGGLAVPAGDYTIYTVPADGAFKLVINKEIFQFHTVYHADQDLGRVDMTMTKTETPIELVTFSLASTSATAGTLKLGWDDREYSVTVTFRN